MRASMSARFSAMVMTTNLPIHHSGLNALLRSAERLNPSLPLVLMTDDRKADWLRAAQALPRGSVVVVRAHDRARRRALADELYGSARLLIAGDPGLAAEIGA